MELQILTFLKLVKSVNDEERSFFRLVFVVFKKNSIMAIPFEAGGNLHSLEISFCDHIKILKYNTFITINKKK
jgi:hypothetical protein